MPNGNLTYRRGEIRWVDLEPTIGKEAKKTRACLIIQNNVGNRYSFLTVVIPLLPGNKNVPYVVNVKATPSNGLDQDRYLDVGQIRGLDNSRVLDERRSIGRRVLGLDTHLLEYSIGFLKVYPR